MLASQDHLARELEAHERGRNAGLEEFAARQRVGFEVEVGHAARAVEREGSPRGSAGDDRDAFDPLGELRAMREQRRDVGERTDRGDGQGPLFEGPREAEDGVIAREAAVLVARGRGALRDAGR